MIPTKTYKKVETIVLYFVIKKNLEISFRNGPGHETTSLTKNTFSRNYFYQGLFFMGIFFRGLFFQGFFPEDFFSGTLNGDFFFM